MVQIRPLPQELQEIACKELGETSERISEDLKTLKAWIQMQPHLKSCTDDQFLIQFLRGSKYSMEKAKAKLEKFYSLKTNYSDMLSSVDVNSTLFCEYVKSKSFNPLPIPLNGNGPRIIYVRFGVDPRRITTNQVIQCVITFLELLLLSDPYACVNGLVVIFDYSEFSTDFIPLFTPSAVRNLFLFHEKALPVRLKSLYFVNIPAVAERVIRALLPYVPEKLRSRLHFQSSIDDVQNLIPTKYFPKHMGGENGSLDDIYKEYLKLWQYYLEYFKHSVNYGIDEQLRLSKNPSNDSEFGVGGSFRAINVD
ncbi:retinol-binding protein pinta-like [Stomoxys calcitrans]|uniref:retinol-binding protein pinta-like n=1 Tax=Stomoxys calcitrans TaxID=35570 RepID=UPI0027E21901|nr:retinol-binding protein pinta-like [Stomoxys calcitrans]